MTVSEIAQKNVVTASKDTPLGDITRAMAENEVGSVVILEEGTPVGILTDRKIALQTADTPDISDLKASDLMSEDLVSVTSDTGVYDLVQTFGNEGIRRIPVVDDGELKGIVSLDDVIVMLSTEFTNVADVIKKQSPRL